MKNLLIIFSLFTASCGATYCGMDTVTKSNRTIELQRQYGLKYHAPDTTIFVSERNVMRTKTYQLWEVYIGDRRYTVEYFAPTKRQAGFARVFDITVTGKEVEVDCDGVFQIESLMANKYPF